MSTRFTTERPLSVLLHAAAEDVLRRLRDGLHARGWREVTTPQLVLFGHLDCGATHAALIAQRLGVSRQAISRTLRELETAGLVTLEIDPDRGNRRLVVMTPRGERLALAARAELAAIEAALAERLGAGDAAALRRALEREWGGS